MRATKLSKRIQRDQRISASTRKTLKQRRNIIIFRIRAKNKKIEEELFSNVIPLLLSQVSVYIFKIFPFRVTDIVAEFLSVD